jgi:hypothetical protein
VKERWNKDLLNIAALLYLSSSIAVSCRFHFKPITCHHAADSQLFLNSQKFNKSSRKTSFPGELIHTDIVGSWTKSRGGRIYICVLLDDYTDHLTVNLLSRKSEVAKCLETYNNFVKT